MTTWIEIVETDFNRLPRNGVYFCRAFSYKDGSGAPEIGQTVFICNGGESVLDGTPGQLGVVTKIHDKIYETDLHAGTKWVDYYRYVDVKPND